MLKLKTSVFRMLLLCLAAAVLLPLESAAQTVTGSISGTVLDPQGGGRPRRHCHRHQRVEQRLARGRDR